jgi:hypothetical protein
MSDSWFTDGCRRMPHERRPYRSLPMPPRWKKAAKCAYLPSFTPREIADALERAAERDCRAELSAPFVGRVCALIMPNEPDLFRDPPKPNST